MFSYTYPFDYSRVHLIIFVGPFDINLTSLMLKIQSLNDNRKSHYMKFWYYLLKKRYKKRDRLTSILKIQEMFWFDPTKKSAQIPLGNPC